MTALIGARSRRCMSCVLHGRQRGNALLVSMIMLLLVLLLAVVGMRVATLEARIAANMVDSQRLYETADGTLREGERKLLEHAVALKPCNGAGTPVAESSGMIVAIGEWVIHTAVRDTKRWLDLHLPLRAVSVNVSAVQFRHPQLPEMVTRCLEQAGLPARRLELELTEGAAVDDPAAALAMMDQLHDRGVRLSMDDFGTGYSSLSYLKRFQIYKLKIDQSFVRDLEEDANDRAIVSAIIRMAQALGMQTTAEGVETDGQLEFLRAQGCDEAQGFYFSRPLPADAFEAYLRQQQEQQSSSSG